MAGRTPSPREKREARTMTFILYILTCMELWAGFKVNGIPVIHDF